MKDVKKVLKGKLLDKSNPDARPGDTLYKGPEGDLPNIRVIFWGNGPGIQEKSGGLETPCLTRKAWGVNGKIPVSNTHGKRGGAHFPQGGEVPGGPWKRGGGKYRDF